MPPLRHKSSLEHTLRFPTNFAPPLPFGHAGMEKVLASKMDSRVAFLEDEKAVKYWLQQNLKNKYRIFEVRYRTTIYRIGHRPHARHDTWIE